jgi:hypothetical protein
MDIDGDASSLQRCDTQMNPIQLLDHMSRQGDNKQNLHSQSSQQMDWIHSHKT